MTTLALLVELALSSRAVSRLFETLAIGGLSIAAALGITAVTGEPMAHSVGYVALVAAVVKGRL